MKTATNEKKKVEVKVDFATVWAFMWRWIVLVLGTSFVVGLIISAL